MVACCIVRRKRRQGFKVGPTGFSSSVSSNDYSATLNSSHIPWPAQSFLAYHYYCIHCVSVIAMLNGFGFSAGDFIAGVKLIIDLLQAFKQRSGAVEKHAAQVAYLDCLNLTIGRLDKYTDETPTDEAATRWMEQLKEPLAAFKTYLDQYQALKPDVEASFAAKQWAKVALTVDEVNEKIDKLRVQIVEPLPSINLLLSLQIM